MQPITDDVSGLTDLAFTLDGHVMEISTQGALTIDHAGYSLPVGQMLDFGDGAGLARDANGYLAVWPGYGARPILLMQDGGATLYLPPGSNTYGLLGDGNGNPNDDLVTGFGQQLPSNASTTTLLGTFADSWRIAQDESLFTYAAEESTDTFTDTTFPSDIVTINDLSDSAREQGTQQCEAAAVTDGPQFDDCVVDWAETQDSDFVTAAAQDATPAMAGGSATVAADGVVTQNFVGTVPPNFASAKYGDEPGIGVFAGPFTGLDRYNFYVPELPGHDTATVQFNLITLGQASPDMGDMPVSVDVDGQSAWTGALAFMTPTATGTTTSGEPYAVYPVSFTTPHSAKQMNVGISANIPVGSDFAFGVNDISVALDLVSPQAFNVSLPASISPGVPSAGAGDLETTGSEDDYDFSTSSAGGLVLDFSNCTDKLSVALVDSDNGSQVWSTAGGTINGQVVVPNVPAGNYKVQVTDPGNTATYDLSVFQQSAADAFNVSLPASISPGVPSAGAGDLETTSSEDDYDFSTSTAGGLVLDFSNVSSKVTVALVNTDSGSQVWSTGGGNMNNQVVIPNVPAGNYGVQVTDPGNTSTYDLSIFQQPAPDAFNVSLPASISPGVPSAGAGNLETTASEDDYKFSTSTAGELDLDFSNCTDKVMVALVNTDNGSQVWSTGGGTTNGNNSIPNVPAGNYKVQVTDPGNTATYNLSISQKGPQQFSVSLPASISPGVPSAGAGDLETTSSEDDYDFSTSTAGGLVLDFSNVSSKVTVALVNTDSGSQVWSTGGGNMNNQVVIPNVPAGNYGVQVTDPGNTSTYDLSIFQQPAPDAFNVSLPASISPGVPSAGAGNLETTASEDDYKFSTSTAGGLDLDFSNCTDKVMVALVNTDNGSQVWSTGGGTTNGNNSIPNVPAGNYKVQVTDPGNTATYNLSISQKGPQQFSVSLPASISPGVPSAGAGDLETTSSEDDYDFSTSTAGGLVLDFSNVSSKVTVALVNTDSGSQVWSTGGGNMNNQVVIPNVPAGNYGVQVTDPGNTSTYDLSIFQQPAPDAFNVSLPASISPGVPSAGAGNLETTASEDDYKFSTSTAGELDLDFSNCTDKVMVALVNTDNGSQVWSTGGGTTNGNNSIPNVPAGNYKVQVTDPGNTATYNLSISQAS